MIDTLLGKIAGFFEKDFLFASLLPALILTSCVVATLAAVIGLESMWLLLESITLIQQITMTILAAIALVAFAYVLNSLRPLMARFWSGYYHFVIFWGLVRLGEYWQTRTFERTRSAANQLSPWARRWGRLREEIGAVYGQGTEALPGAERERLTNIVADLSADTDEAQQLQTLEPLLDAYKRYKGDELAEVFSTLKRKFDDWHADTESLYQSLSYRLDRNFAGIGVIRATALGNVIESYNQYSYKRYRIEGEIFWPRLRKVIAPEYRAVLDEPRIILDFALTTASLSLAYAGLALFVGPWLWYALWPWLLLALVAFLVCFLAYRLSIHAARQLGEVMRSSFDLFRLDLLTALHMPFPATYHDERARWTILSKLATYGIVSGDFPLRPPRESDPEETKGQRAEAKREASPPNPAKG